MTNHPELVVQLLGLAALMGCSALFSGLETAFSALGKTQAQRIRGDGRPSSKHIAAFLDNPRRFFITVLFGNIFELFAKAREAGYSRLPRWRGRRVGGEGDQEIEDLAIEEFLLARPRLCRHHPGAEDTLIRPPLFTYEAKDIIALLQEMTRQRQRLAILLVEYGGLAGLATIQDIVAEGPAAWMPALALPVLAVTLVGASGGLAVPPSALGDLLFAAIFVLPGPAGPGGAAADGLKDRDFRKGPRVRCMWMGIRKRKVNQTNRRRGR